MKDTYYKRVLERQELGYEVAWNEIHWYNYWSRSGKQSWPERYGIRLPNKLGLGNLHDSLYVEYWGWEYGLPEKSPPERNRRKQTGIISLCGLGPIKFMMKQKKKKKLGC